MADLNPIFSIVCSQVSDILRNNKIDCRIYGFTIVDQGPSDPENYIKVITPPNEVEAYYPDSHAQDLQIASSIFLMNAIIGAILSTSFSSGDFSLFHCSSTKKDDGTTVQIVEDLRVYYHGSLSHNGGLVTTDGDQIVIYVNLKGKTQ